MNYRIALLFLLFVVTPVLAKPIEIVLWHSMSGHLGTAMKRVVDGFNQGQQEYVIKPIYKGDYVESLTSFAAAFRAKQPPSLVQVADVGTGTMLIPKGIIKPASEILQPDTLRLLKTSFFPAITANYSQANGLVAMPFNISVPVLFYNVDAIENAGYSQATFPKTWDELAILAKKLQQQGFHCVYTTAYPAWILIEAFSSLHGLTMADPLNHSANFNSQAVIGYLNRLVNWQKLGYFEYGGRVDDATILFTSGRCPLFSQSSGGYNSLVSLVPFRVGIAPLPIDTQVSKTRHSNVVGGAALWAVAGQSPGVYKGIAKFFDYVARPEVQLEWSNNTGYLPLGIGGVYQAIMRDNNSQLLAIAQSELAIFTTPDRVNHEGAQHLIRAINDEALEAIFAGIKTPKQAMNEAVTRANYAMIRFSHNTH